MRRRSSRATSSWRVGAVLTCNRTVDEVRSRLCRPRIRGPSTSACDQAGSLLRAAAATDRKSTRLNSSHLVISYAVFCLKKKKKKKTKHYYTSHCKRQTL